MRKADSGDEDQEQAQGNHQKPNQQASSSRKSLPREKHEPTPTHDAQHHYPPPQFSAINNVPHHPQVSDNSDKSSKQRKTLYSAISSSSSRLANQLFPAGGAAAQLFLPSARRRASAGPALHYQVQSDNIRKPTDLFRKQLQEDKKLYGPKTIPNLLSNQQRHPPSSKQPSAQQQHGGGGGNRKVSSGRKSQETNASQSTIQQKQDTNTAIRGDHESEEDLDQDVPTTMVGGGGGGREETKDQNHTNPTAGRQQSTASPESQSTIQINPAGPDNIFQQIGSINTGIKTRRHPWTILHYSPTKVTIYWFEYWLITYRLIDRHSGTG